MVLVYGGMLYIDFSMVCAFMQLENRSVTLLTTFCEQVFFLIAKK